MTTPAQELKPFEVVDQNLRSAMRFYGLAPEHGEELHTHGLLMVSSGINFGPFNAALITERCTEQELVGSLRRAEDHFASRKLRWSCWVCNDLLGEELAKRARGIFADHHLFPLTDPPGMLAETLAPPSRWLPELDCRPVADEATRTDFCDITSTVFDVPFSVSRRIYGSERSWALGLRGWVGYLDRRPVATTATMAAGGSIGVYSVATLPRFRRHGYAERLMRHALDRARESAGIERTVLQTTRNGLRMYQQMGYRVVTRFSVYIVG